MTCVYLHFRLDTNEVFYVGIGNKRRSKDMLDRNYHWENIVKKHGYRIEIIHEFETRNEAVQKEIELIAYYGRRDIGTGSLCNMTDGGEGSIGRIISEKHKNKIREVHTGRIPSPETRAKMSLSQKNKIVTKETREKISASTKGIKKLSDEHRAKIKEITGTIEFRLKVSEFHTGKKRSDESRKKMSEAKKKYYELKTGQLSLLINQ